MAASTQFRLASLVRRFFRQTHGQDLIEYGVLIALIAAVVIVAINGLGVKVPGMYSTAAQNLPGGAPAAPGDTGGPGSGNDPGNGNPGNGNPGNGNPGNGNPGGGNGNPGNGNPGNGNPGGGNGNPGNGNPGNGNPVGNPGNENPGRGGSNQGN